MTTYTDPIGHQVDQYFLLRQIEQQADDQTTTYTAELFPDTANEEV